MLALSNAKNSFQWMILAGVDPKDVEWLERMNGSKELHLPEAKERVENIYKVAMDGMLSSAAPASILMLSLN